MNKCLNESCKKEYESKTLTSKFCSTSCRVIHHRKVGKQKNSGLSEKYMIKAIYNKMMEIGSDVKINEVSKPIVYESKKENEIEEYQSPFSTNKTKGKKTMSYFMDLLVDLDKNCTDDVLRVTRDVEESTDINSTDRQKLLFALKEGTY